MKSLAIIVGVAACGSPHATIDASILGGDTRVVDAALVDAALDTPLAIDARRPADAMPDALDPQMPATLQGTGLCADAACQVIGADAHPYAPRFPLWSDGATKQRWIYLPPGTQIDTSDMDYWKFPVGTKVWKEFTRDGVRVETRYMTKLADESTSNAWYYVAYAWNATQDATVAVSAGAQNVNGTQHDIPSRAQCQGCHERLVGADQHRGRVLGFGAIQLDAVGAIGSYDLATLVASNLLTANPSGTSPYFPLTGLTAHEQAAFGYLHANCGHCHNATSSVQSMTPIELRLATAKLASAAVIPAVTTTVSIVEHRNYPNLPASSLLVSPHDTAHSVLYKRMLDQAAQYHMPQLGSEVVDGTGTDAVATWIGDLP